MLSRDDALRMAREAGIRHEPSIFPQHDCTTEDLVRFAALIEAEVTEACAKVCDGVESDRWDCYKGRGNHERFSAGRANPVVGGAAEGASLCAAAIRARAGGTGGAG